MTLGQKQRAFAHAFACLILEAYEMGYEVTLGDAFRDPRAFGPHGANKRGVYGRSQSLHKLRLAADLNLFKGGRYLTSTKAHQPLGEWWELEYASLDASWGGRFADGNHYSFAHQGFR
jgi:hypothetical protein